MNEQFRPKQLISSLVFAIILPLVAYLGLKMLGWADTPALGVATAFPVLQMIYSLVRSRTINPISLVAIAGFLISLLAVYLTHGNNLAFKLWHPILTATIGLILLATVALNRPLLELVSQENAAGAEHKYFMLFTGYMGLVFALHATTVIVLAFTLDTTKFVIISKIVDFSAIAVLLGGMALLRQFNQKKGEH